MDRRDFLRRAGLIAAGAVAADQMDLLDRLGWKRKFFPGWSAPNWDSRFDAKLEPLMREAWQAGWNPGEGYTIRFAPDEPIIMEYKLSAVHRESIVGATFTPDIWSPPTAARHSAV